MYVLKGKKRALAQGFCVILGEIDVLGDFRKVEGGGRSYLFDWGDTGVLR